MSRNGLLCESAGENRGSRPGRLTNLACEGRIVRLFLRPSGRRLKRLKFPDAFIHRTLRNGAACLILFALAGCSATRAPVPPPQPRPAAAFHPGEVVETATGRVMDMDRLAAKLSKVDVVYVGETHTSVQDHEVQLEILRKLSRGGRCVELGMEMFPASVQPVLDRYIDGESSERDFLREVDWEKTWGFPYSLYKGLIDWQKQRRMAVIGLNASLPVVRLIARNGLGSLTPAERAQVARVFHLNDPADRERIKAAFLAHGRFEIKDFGALFEAQLAWEETMAQTLARRLDRTHCIIVVVLGKGHMSERRGVPHLTLLRRPKTACRTVVPVPEDYPRNEMTPSLADYVVMTGRSERPHPPRLGILIEPAPPSPGVRIAGTLPDTPAEAAGLQKGDIILSINGAPVKNATEVRQAVAQAGSVCKLLIERKKIRMAVEAPLRP